MSGSTCSRSAANDSGLVVPAIGNEPGRGILPVVSAVPVRAPDIALSLAFLAKGAPDCNGWLADGFRDGDANSAEKRAVEPQPMS